METIDIEMMNETEKLNKVKELFYGKLMRGIKPLLEALYTDVEFAIKIVSQSYDASLMYKISELALGSKKSVDGNILFTAICAEIHGAIDMKRPKTLMDLLDILHFKNLQTLTLDEAEEQCKKGKK
jgi:hypothetical protein